MASRLGELRRYDVMWALAVVVLIIAVFLLPQTLLLSLVLPVVGFALFLTVWAFRWSEHVGDARLNRVHIATESAAHWLTAMGVLGVALLFIEERQWAPRLSIEVKADAVQLPAAPKRTAVVQLAIAITNDGRVSESVDFIEVAAFGLRGAAMQNPKENEDLQAIEFYKIRTSRTLGIGPSETEYQYVEVPVSCDWTLVRFLVKVPVPPAHMRRGDEKILVYERKLLVPLDGVCGAPQLQSAGAPKATWPQSAPAHHPRQPQRGVTSQAS